MFIIGVPAAAMVNFRSMFTLGVGKNSLVGAGIVVGTFAFGLFAMMGGLNPS